MFLPSLRAWLQNGRRVSRRSRRGRQTWAPRVERLEQRLVLAASITVVVGASGSGTQDTNLLADGQILFADSDLGGNTLSTGALAAVPATTDITVQATATIDFNDLGGTLSLQTGAANNVSFNTASGAITFANQGNTLAAAG